ncbi:MAG TPA: type II toxin-antitoxin system VapC family toxin [Thermoanaerobaculia bacterium]
MIVVDTHAWLWWAAERHKLSHAAVDALTETEGIAIASITLWEIAMLAEKKRLTLDRDVLVWLEDTITNTGARVLLLTPQIAVLATSIAPLRDPADRLIAATAISHNAPLVTKDDRIRNSGVVETIW